MVVRGAGVDGMMCGVLSHYVAAGHYGQLSASMQHYEYAAECVDKMLSLPNQEGEAAQKITYLIWWPVAVDMNHPEPLRVALDKMQLTWSNADETIDQLALHATNLNLRPRGETTDGHAFSCECLSWLSKTIYVLVASEESELDADEIVDSLPSWEEHLALARAR